MADKTNRTIVILPALFMSVAFQPGSLFAIFSIQGIRSIFLNFLLDKGSPKVVQGNSDMLHGRVLLTVVMEFSSQLMGIMLLLCRFVCRPEADPKILRISLVTCNSSPLGLMNNATSSAYKDKRCPKILEERGCYSPFPHLLSQTSYLTRP